MSKHPMNLHGFEQDDDNPYEFIWFWRVGFPDRRTDKKPRLNKTQQRTSINLAPANTNYIEGTIPMFSYVFCDVPLNFYDCLCCSMIF